MEQLRHRSFGSNDHPACPKCGQRMYISRRTPHPLAPEHEVQTLTCDACEVELIRSVDRDGRAASIRFSVGQAVDYHPPLRLHAPVGPYVVRAVLPERDGEVQYHIKHPREPHERMVRESELIEPTEDAATLVR